MGNKSVVPLKQAYEWQFLDAQNVWVKYGEISVNNEATTATIEDSDFIEQEYAKDPTQTITIQSKKYSYKLDFQNLTQTNNETNVVRKIRRQIDSSENKSVVPLKQAYEWQFLDAQNSWVKYGGITANNEATTATIEDSDFIEQEYAKDPTQTITIQSKKYSYKLDFQNLTQTNNETNVVRKIRRKIDSAENKSVASLKQAYEWQFLDAQNVWVKYGGITANNEAITATTVDSDFIEQEYAKDPTQTITIQSNKFSYELDFQNLTQTNVKTNVVRKIQRVASDTQKGYILKNFPKNWTNVDVNKLTTVTLTHNDVDYQKNLNLITKTLGSRNIIKIVRVQHPHLWQAFDCEKNNLKSQFPSVTYNEMSLFHGTNHANIQSICMNNFDWRRAGSSTGTLYGYGIYFSNNAKVSDGFSKGKPQCIFIARVIVGKTFEGKPDIRFPDSGFDTAVNDTSNPSYFIKFEKNECYPEFYVEYK